MDGFGNINWWGFSPSLDLLKFHKDIIGTSDSEDDYLNVLLVSAGDQRHIFETIANRAKHGNKKKIRFFVYEKMLELYARHFLLLNLAIEHPSKRGIQEKTELYLEIFGNILLRDHTSQLVQAKANEFVKCITDFDYLEKAGLDLFDFSLLKFKERDFLEGIFKFWRLKSQDISKDPFQAEKCWDIRLRTYFGTRFDTRSNAYDWDYNMKLADRSNCLIINNKVYSKWRDTGVGFELRDSNYDTPNRTLASGMVFNDPRNGDKTSRRGYFGDIIVGPFISYGIKSDNEEHFKKQNDHYRYTSVEISRSNVSSYMKSILESSGIDLKKYQNEPIDAAASKISELKIEEVNEDEEEILKEEETKKESENEPNYIKLDDVKISFLPLTAFQDLPQKAKFENFFDIVYFSNSGVSNLNKSLLKIFKPNALVFMETAKFMIEMSKEQINSFVDRLKAIAKENELIDLNDKVKKPDAPKAKKSEEGDAAANVVLDQSEYLLFKTKPV